MIKKIFKILLITLLALVGIAFAAPFLFKDKIILKIKSTINENLNAQVDFTDSDLSLFRHFPRVAVAIHDIRVVGIGEFSRDTLISANTIDVAVDLISAIRGTDMKVYSVTLESPRIHAIVNKDGKANWDITKADTVVVDTGETKPFKMELKHYSINNGYVSYVDKEGNMNAEIINLNHEGSGDFTSDLFMLKTQSTADAVNFSYGNIPYLINSKAEIDADIEVNNKTNTYKFETDNILVNNLKLATKGFIQILNDSIYNMDISFNAPSTDFKNILSLVPTIYKNDFSKIKTSGTAIFKGFVKGTYSTNHIPAYSIDLDIKNGFFQYSDLPRPVKNINLTLKVDNPDGITDHTVVNIPNGHIEMDNEPFDFRLLMKNPMTDMFIDAAVKGKLDLSKISQFVKLEAGTKLSGLLKADLSAVGTISSMEKQQYDQFDASGTLGVSSLQYASNAYPDGVKVNNLFMTFNPRDITISDLDGQYKRSNFSANGTISNLLPYMLKNKTLSGKLFLKADRMNLNDWMDTPADTATQAATQTSTQVSTQTATQAPGDAPFAVPANINLDINAQVGRLLYDKLEIQDLTGNITMKDEEVIMNNIKGDALDGSMWINGSYSTKVSKKQPDISLHYDVKGLDVQKTFYAFNTIQKLMPIGQYLAGRLSSQLNMTGKLGMDMMPDLATLTGKGNLLLIEGFLKKFAPLEKLAELLDVNELKEITVRDVKNYLEFNNGMVLVKPFTVKVKDIEMQIGGMHGLNQSLDYLINLKIPRALMGNKGNAYVDNLVTQINNKGIPIKLSETVNLHIKMGGTIKSPVFQIDLKQASLNMAEELKKQAIVFVQSKIDSTKKAITDTAMSVRKELQKDVEEEIRNRIYGNKDSTKTTGSGVDSARKRLEQSGKGLVKDLFKRKKTTDTTKSQ